jgi:hypothetical protein
VHLFGLLKHAFRGRHVADTDGLNGAREEFRRFSEEFYATGIENLTQRWKNCVYNE